MREDEEGLAITTCDDCNGKGDGCNSCGGSGAIFRSYGVAHPYSLEGLKSAERLAALIKAGIA